MLSLRKKQTYLNYHKNSSADKGMELQHLYQIIIKQPFDKTNDLGFASGKDRSA